MNHPLKKKAFTKLRLSNHNLEYEKGRYRNCRPEQRFCRHCNDGSIEDEKHFVMKCKLYQADRACLFQKISLSNAPFRHFSETDKFIFIMQYKTNMHDILNKKNKNMNIRKSLEIGNTLP